MDNTVWRVVADQYTLPPFDPLDGKGAERIGGRWNSPGVAVTYLSGSLSLAVLEVLVHSGRIDSLTGKMAIALTVPERDIRTIRTSEMPQDWQDPATNNALREIGDRWLAKGDTPVLRVPSAVIPVEFNYLLNPVHPHFARIRGTATPKQPLPLDPRLLQVK